jgi:hypothetical protein
MARSLKRARAIASPGPDEEDAGQRLHPALRVDAAVTGWGSPAAGVIATSLVR